jgi:hypothetical protein
MTKLPPPTESEEQQALFTWAALQRGRYPELDLLFVIPNGGLRHKATAGRLKAEGVKAGVPDVCLPVARGEWHGLYIELKRVRGGKGRDGQERWLAELRDQGYYTAVCHGWMEAMRVIMKYLEDDDGEK